MILEMDRIFFHQIAKYFTCFLLPSPQMLNKLKTGFSAGSFGSCSVTLLGGTEIPYVVGCVCSFISFLGSYPWIHISSFILTKIELDFLLTNGKNNA